MQRDQIDLQTWHWLILPQTIKNIIKKTKTKTQEDDEGKQTIQFRKGLGAMVERITPAIIRYHQWREKSNLNNSIIPSFFYIFLRKMKRRIYTQDHTKGFAMQMKNSLSVTRKYMNITPVKLSGPWKRLEFQKRVGIFWLYSNNSVSIKVELKERHTISQQHVWSQQYVRESWFRLTSTWNRVPHWENDKIWMV